MGQPVNCVSLSNDGNCILAGCLDSTLRLLDRCLLSSDHNINVKILKFLIVLIPLCNGRSTGELLQEYKGHTCKVRTDLYLDLAGCLLMLTHFLLSTNIFLGTLRKDSSLVYSLLLHIRITSFYPIRSCRIISHLSSNLSQ